MFSPSATTTSFIVSTFAGSRVTTIDTIAILVERMRSGLPCGLLIVDCQSSEALEAVLAHANPLDHPHILRLLAPSIEALKSRSEVLEGVTVLYHPLRRRRLLDMALQLASRLKRTRSADERLQAVPMSSPPAKTIDLFTAAERDVLAHTRVLIAEDNQISARLLVKTLERVKLTVTATSNGTDAVNEWAAHPEGYFALALFDQFVPPPCLARSPTIALTTPAPCMHPQPHARRQQLGPKRRRPGPPPREPQGPQGAAAHHRPQRRRPADRARALHLVRHGRLPLEAAFVRPRLACVLKSTCALTLLFLPLRQRTPCRRSPSAGPRRARPPVHHPARPDAPAEPDVDQLDRVGHLAAHDPGDARRSRAVDVPVGGDVDARPPVGQLVAGRPLAREVARVARLSFARSL